MNELHVRRAAPPRRSRKKIILVTASVVLVIGGAVGLALFQPWKLFTHSTVNEAVPAAFAVSASATAGSVPAQSPATAGPSAAPTLGQDNDRVVRELLGYDEARIAHLNEIGALT